MQITGTKKLLIIMLALVCAGAAGFVGMLWHGNTAHAYTAEANAEDTAGEEITEEEDNFVAPDDASNYAITLYGFNYASWLRLVTSDDSKISGWVPYNDGQSHWWHTTQNYEIYNSPTFEDAVDKLGVETTVTLDPGERFTLTYTDTHIGYGTTWASYSLSIANYHWHSADNELDWSNRPEFRSRDYVIDGDAPTGSTFLIYIWTSDYTTRGFNTNIGGTTSVSSFTSVVCNNIFTFRIIVKRNSPPKPTLVQDGNCTLDTKTVMYDGTPAKISMYPDYGLGVSSLTNINIRGTV